MCNWLCSAALAGRPRGATTQGEHILSFLAGRTRATAHAVASDVRPRLGALVRLLVPRHSLGARLAHGAAWSFAATLAAQAGTVIASIVTARLLGRVQFGELGIIMSTVGSFAVFASLGIGLTATKFVAELVRVDPTRAGRVAGLSMATAAVAGLLGAGILMGFAVPLATQTLNAPHLAGILRLSAPLLVLTTISGAQQGILAGLEAFRPLARLNAIRGVLAIPVTAVLVVGFGLTGAVLSLSVVTLIGCALSEHAIRVALRSMDVRISYREMPRELSVLLGFSLPAFLSVLVSGPALWVASAILAHQPHGYSELAVLNVASQWRNALVLLPTAFSAAAIPLLSSLSSDSERTDVLHRGVELANLLNQIALWPIGTLLIFAAPVILGLYGTSFSEGRSALVLVLGGTAVGYVASALGSVTVSRGLMWLGVVQNLLFGAMLILITWLGAPRYGAVAVGAGMTVAYTFQALWSAAYMQWRGYLPTGFGARVARGSLAFGALVVVGALVPSWLAVSIAVPTAIAAMFLGPRLTADGDLQRIILQRMSSLTRHPKPRRDAATGVVD